MTSLWRLLRLPLFLAVLVTVSGCSDTRGGPVPYDVTLSAPDTADPIFEDDDALIRRMDALRVTVHRVPDLSGEYKVGVDGAVSLPLIGPVAAAGLTTEEFRRHIELRYKDSYLQNPSISVIRTEVAPRTVTVEGSVQMPGIYPVEQRLTLLRALALARGMSETANERRVVIFRVIDGHRSAAAFDIKAIREGEMGDPRVYGNDVIVVDGSDRQKAFRTFIQTIPLITFVRLL